MPVGAVSSQAHEMLCGTVVGSLLRYAQDFLARRLEMQASRACRPNPLPECQSWRDTPPYSSFLLEPG